MKPSIRTLAFSFALLAVTSASAVADSTENDIQSTHTAATELHWLDSGFGPQVSPIDGDFSTGEHVTYVRFTAGMATPLHTHTADYVGIVITGVTMHREPGKPETEKQLSAGAHWFMPANVRHISECLPGAECIVALFMQKMMCGCYWENARANTWTRVVGWRQHVCCSWFPSDRKGQPCCNGS